ncbi:hypothetical protein [Lactococcus allomyrinae]|uniref:Uncharacterized protein n=1 Tax=Lactococcus allomyrinae TaxID=2419773 RepID=A0A387BFF0_9LACT|nr:hypothetical protein [Lactococcus allomyrinae]AYF99835.1 hypothetical protein D7I46_01285 [Lactococcus allomyrinae]
MSSQYLNEPIKIYSTQKKDMKLFRGVNVWYIGAGAVQLPLFMSLYNQKLSLGFIIPIIIITTVLSLNGVRWSNKYKGRRNYRNILRSLTQRRQKFQTYNIKAIQWAEVEAAEYDVYNDTVDAIESLILERMARLGIVDAQELKAINQSIH